MNLNLFLAVFWLILGAALIVWPYVSPQAPDLIIRGTGISAGWLGIVLAIYNLARWVSTRSSRAQRQAEAELQERRKLHSEQSPPPRERDPDLDFTDRAPPP